MAEQSAKQEEVSSSSPTVPPEPSEQVPTSRPRKKQAEIRLAQNFDQMQQMLLQQQSQEPAQDPSQETNGRFELDEQINIPEKTFHEAIQAFILHASTSKRMNIVAALQQVSHELNHNRWICKVGNEVQQDIIEKEDELLPFLRAKLNIPTLFRELQIEHIPQEKSPSVPYTQEEKLKVMAEQNPSLAKLQKLFSTRIIYE